MKEKDKILILNSILGVTILMISISVILKLFGLNFFGLDFENQILNSISNFLEKSKVYYILSAIILFIDYFIIFRLSCSNKNIKIYYLASFLAILINNLGQLLFFKTLSGVFYSVFSISIIIITSSIIDKQIKIKKPILIVGLIFLYQIIALFLRNVTYVTTNETYTTLCDLLLNFDYIILMIITYYLYLKKGSDFKCSVVGKVAQLSSQIKDLLLELQKNWQKFSNSNKQEKAEAIIYIILSILWECFTLSVLLIVAILNHTLVECLFILSAFVITKTVFGTPFHFKSAITCFIVSNLTYYALNRITVSIGISYIIPITLGILLAYFTSKLVKKNTKKLYRGISKDDLMEICENKDLDKKELELLTDFYCNRMSAPALSIKYHYSERALFDKRKKALEKIKEQK